MLGNEPTRRRIASRQSGLPSVVMPAGSLGASHKPDCTRDAAVQGADASRISYPVEQLSSIATCVRSMMNCLRFALMMMGGVPNAVCIKLTINQEIAILKVYQKTMTSCPSVYGPAEKGPGSNFNTACVDSRSRRCLRANENPRPLRWLIFRGSIPHPMQSLCTLRNHCRQWPRNTRYQADATPYFGRTCTGWIAPALPGALIQSPRRRGRVRLTQPPCHLPSSTVEMCDARHRRYNHGHGAM